MTPLPWKSQNTQQGGTGGGGRSPTLLAAEGRNSWVSQHLFLPAGNQTGMALAIGWSLQRSRARMGQGCFEGSSSSKNPGDKFPFLLFWGRNPLKILILHLGRREIKGRGWTWPWCVSVNSIWVLDASCLCVGSWCEARWAKRTHPYGSPPVENLEQPLKPFPCI